MNLFQVFLSVDCCVLWSQHFSICSNFWILCWCAVVFFQYFDCFWEKILLEKIILVLDNIVLVLMHILLPSLNKLTSFVKWCVSTWITEDSGFWTTHSAGGSYEFSSVCPFVCPSVFPSATLFSQNWFITFSGFCFFCLKLAFKKHWKMRQPLFKKSS